VTRKSITAEQLMAAMQGDLRALAEKIAAAMNQAKARHIIADTEEPVRDACAVFRERAYQKALDLLAQQAGKEAFPPSGQRGAGPVEE
jgi:transcription elongation GreA/GreB family factor